jgi:probable rRNA maturation factor
MIFFTIDDLYINDIEQSKLESVALKTLDHEHTAQESDLTLVFTQDAEIQALNKQFLDNDHPTDVLSFPAGEIDPDSGHLYLGDIIISVPQAKSQAQAGGHALGQELEVLVIHGALHLIGHDHAEDDEKARMWAAQKEILQQCKNPLASQF